jgi:hypothetical protein
MRLWRGDQWWSLRAPWTALIGFGLWLGLLLASLAFEHRAFARHLFDSDLGGSIYMGVAVALYVVAFAACLATLMLGSKRTRLVLLVPTLCLVLYGMMLVAGPG